MAKFNVVQKMKRERAQEKKRAIHGDPNSGKICLKNRRTTLTSQTMSGKRKQKLLRKWRRDQKDAVEKGLVTMEDIDMITAEDNSEGAKEKKGSVKVHMKKKSSKLQIKKLKGKGRTKGKGGKENDATPKADAMVE